MKNVLIISSSPRKNSNSGALAAEFARGATEAGNSVETINLRGADIAFCRGCLACQKTQKCVIKDDACAIAEKMLAADVLVFATPVYYYSVSGQLKTMLDRANPLYCADYAFREVYLIACAADDADSAVEGAETAIRGWVDCFERAEFCGTVFAGGVNDPGDVAEHEALTRAYNMGCAL